MSDMKLKKPKNMLLVLLITAIFISATVASALLGKPPKEMEINSINFWLALLTLVATPIVAVTVDHLLSRRSSEFQAEEPGERLKRRIRAVNTAFTDAAVLMDELQRDLDAQQAAREQLLAQADEQQRLLAVDQEQAEKIRQILVGETKATIRAERRQQWLFFALVVTVSIPIGVLINLLVP
jgi:hypothetical protein